MSDYKSYERTASPHTIINSNGSRYTAPIDILRSEAGRAEIMSHRSSQTAARDASRPQGDAAKNGDRENNR